MASPRLQRILATLCPSLFFTLPGTDDSVPVFSVAGLVATVLVFMFPGCLLAYLYNAVAYYYPRVIIFGVPPSIVQAMNAFPPILADRSFLATYAAALLATSPLVSWYLENAMVEKTSQFRVAWDFAWIGRVTAFLESTLKSAIEKTETLLDMLSGSRTKLEEELKRKEQELEEIRRRSIEQHELAIAEHNDEMQRLRLKLANSYRVAEQQQQEAYDREREEAEAARKARFKDLVLAHRREEHQALLFAKKKTHLKARLASVNKNLEATTAAYRTDATRFDRQRATHEAQYSALQGSLNFATAEHRYHTERCERDRDVAQDRLERLANELDEARRTHASQMAATQRLHELEMSTLNAKNDLLKDRLISTTATRDAIMVSYKAHIEQTNKHLSAREVHYTALEGSLAFATAEHRIHIEHCVGERAKNESCIEELTTQLAAERSTQAVLREEHDGLKNRHVMVSEGFADAEEKLKVTERKLYLEKQRHDSAIAAYRACQQVSDTLIEQLTAAPLKGQSPPRAHSLLRQVLISQATAVQNKFPEPEEPYFAEQLSHTLPPSTLFDESWTLPHPDSIDGSTRVEMSVPDFDSIGITATSTPARPCEEREEILGWSPSSSESADSDMSLASTTEDSDSDLSLLLSRSMQSISPSSSHSSLSLGSTSSDMSLASIIEKPCEEPFASGPSTSESAGSDMSLTSTIGGHHRNDSDFSPLLSCSAHTMSTSLSSLDLGSTDSNMSLASVVQGHSQVTSTHTSPPPDLPVHDADIEFEPSLPPPPETSFQLEQDDSLEASSADCSEASISFEFPLPFTARSRPAVDQEPSLPPPPEDLLDASSSLFLLPDSSVDSTNGRLPEPSSSAVLEEPSLNLEAPPSGGLLETSISFDLGDESFGANVVAKSTPIFTRWVNMQRRANAPESPSRVVDQSRSEIMLRLSQLFTEGWGFDTSDSEVVDVDRTRKHDE